MTSFGYRLNPRYAIKKCSSCGTLYTRDCVCSIGNVEDKILAPKPPKNCAWYTRCGYLVDGLNCQGCALLRQELEENLVTHSPDFQNTSEPSNASTNFVNVPREPYLPVCYDDDDDEERSDSLDDNIIFGFPLFSTITPNEPVLSIEELDNSLSMEDEHLDTILATKSDEFIKSSVENLIPIPSEFEGIPDHMCDVPFHDNSPPLDISKDQFKDFSDSNDEFSSIDHNSFSFDKIDYIEASPPDSELVSSEVMEIVIPEVGGIADDILLTIKDEILRENLLNVNPLFAKIEASNENPIPFYDPIISRTPPNLTPSGESGFFLEVNAFLAVDDDPTSSQFPKSYLDPEGDILLLEAFLNDDYSSDFKTKSSSTSLNSLLEETNNFDNSLPEFTTFSNVLFDAKYESNSSNDQSCSDEDVLEKIVLKPLFKEEIIPMKIDLLPDNAESDLMESLRTHDSS
nr:hypothetical protein [Tanacetum cinerariifolium]